MRAEKKLLLAEIKEKIDGSNAMIVARYEKLEPNIAWQFRERLAKQGSLFEVVRKRVFVKAAAEAGINIDESLLKGHVGIVFVGQGNPIESAKAVYKFSEENGTLLEVLGAQIEGKFVPAAEVEMLSKLPSLADMRAIFLGLLTSPMSQTLSVLEAILSGPLSVIEQKN